MANNNSTIKRIRQNKRSNERNRIIRTKVKTLFKKVENSITMEQKEEGLSTFRTFVSALDKAVKKGIYHKNNAARKKSMLMKKLNLMTIKGQ